MPSPFPDVEGWDLLVQKCTCVAILTLVPSIPSTLTIEVQTIFKQVGLFIKCPVNIKEMKSFSVGHGLQPSVDVQDLVVMYLPSILISG